MCFMKKKLVICMLLAVTLLLAGCTEEAMNEIESASSGGGGGGDHCAGTCMTNTGSCSGSVNYGDYGNCKSTEFCCISTDSSNDRDAIQKYKDSLR